MNPLQDMLRHASSKITEIYTKTIEINNKKIIGAFENLKIIGARRSVFLRRISKRVPCFQLGFIPKALGATLDISKINYLVFR